MGKPPGMDEFLRLAHKHFIKQGGHKFDGTMMECKAALPSLRAPGMKQWKARRTHTHCALKTVFHVSLFTVKLPHILTNLQGISKHGFLHELAMFCHINIDAIILTRTPPQPAQSKDERHGSIQVLYLVR